MTDTAAPMPVTSTVDKPAPFRGLGQVTVALPLVILGIYGAVALLGPAFVEYNHVHTPLEARLLSPGSVLEDGRTAWLGTDALGRDVMSQIVYGARTSMLIATIAAGLACLVGLAVGAIAGYAGGWTDAVLSRTIDVLLAFPGVLLAIVIAGAFPRGITIVIIALSVTAWTPFARVTRGITLSLREREWVSAAQVMGVRRRAILVRHILPFVLGPIIAMVTLEFALIVLAEAGLSFLGIGLPTSEVSWGQIISNGKAYLATAWWISAFPGVALSVLVISVGILGDQLSARFGRARGRSALI